MINEILEFGELIPDADYVLRPGGYAVIHRVVREIAVMQTPRGWFLPGGGQNMNETAEQAAIRETDEESGLRIRLIEPIGMVDQLVFSVDEATYFRKRCAFFLAEQDGEERRSGEIDHELFWLIPQEAEKKLLHDSQRWAVQEYIARYCTHHLTSSRGASSPNEPI